jgi:hypothetical protein
VLAALVGWLTATPEIALASVLAACVFWYRDCRAGNTLDRARQRSFLLLAGLWLAVPLARANLPGMQYHDGIRLFLEVTVPAAVLAGWGIDGVLRALCGDAGSAGTVGMVGWRGTGIQSVGGAARAQPAVPVVRRVPAGLLAAALLTIALYEPIRVYPYELAYFNRASGGLKGAWQRGSPDATDYWGASYRQGIGWLNENLPPGSVVAVPFAEHLVRYTRSAPGGLRADLKLLQISSPYDSANVREAAYHRVLEQGPVTVMFVTRRSWYNAVIRHAQAHGRMLHSFRVDDVPILEIRRVPARQE